MATMYPLFLSFLLIALCSTLGPGDSHVNQKHVFVRSNATRQSELSSQRLLLHCIHRNDVVNKDVRDVQVIPTSNRLPSFGLRRNIINIATAELGVQEATGRNDGQRVETYLRYTHLGKGHAWCAAFVSWCYGQAGLKEPRNPWSPALFPNARTYWKQGKFIDAKIRGFAVADIFGIYSSTAKRINHVGLVMRQQGEYILSIEGNSNNRVESRRRHLRTIYTLSNWID